MMNERELNILDILYSTDVPLMTSDIVNAAPYLTQSTVTAVLRKLLKDEIVEVVGVTHSGRVLSRTYRPTAKAKESVLRHHKEMYEITQHIVSPEEIKGVLK